MSVSSSEQLATPNKDQSHSRTKAGKFLACITVTMLSAALLALYTIAPVLAGSTLDANAMDPRDEPM